LNTVDFEKLSSLSSASRCANDTLKQKCASAVQVLVDYHIFEYVLTL
jgi:hypothetical protein